MCRSRFPPELPYLMWFALQRSRNFWLALTLAQNKISPGSLLPRSIFSPLLASMLNRQIYSGYIISPMLFSGIFPPMSYITALCEAFRKFISLRGIAGNKVSLYFRWRTKIWGLTSSVIKAAHLHFGGNNYILYLLILNHFLKTSTTCDNKNVQLHKLFYGAHL